MSFRLPAKTNPLRALFDMDHLAKIGNREITPTIFEAKGSARRTFERDIAVQSVAFIVVDVTGYVWLIAFERNRDAATMGHYKILWDFGKAFEVVKL